MTSAIGRLAKVNPKSWTLGRTASSAVQMFRGLSKLETCLTSDDNKLRSIKTKFYHRSSDVWTNRRLLKTSEFTKEAHTCLQLLSTWCSPAAAVHLSNDLAAADVPLKGPVIHKALAQRRDRAEVVTTESIGRASAHGLEACELSDLAQRTDPLALRAVAAIQKVLSTHQDAEVVRAVVVIAIGAASRSFHSENVHRPVDAGLEAIKAGGSVASAGHTGLDALHDRCWGRRVGVFNHMKRSESRSLRFAARQGQSSLLNSKKGSSIF
jgi:hypothetical protein